MTEKKPSKALVLLSGGLDSTTCLAIALRENDEVYTVSFDYGQRHVAELQCAEKIALALGVKRHRVIRIDGSYFQGCALTDRQVDVPDFDNARLGIPVTYVPARNTLFLSYALGWAEVLAADYIYIGVNAVDYSGYPDCRPAFIEAFQQMADLATKAGIEGQGVRILTPLMSFSKAQIIQAGLSLGVDYRLTVSCYRADIEGKACGQCDSCHYRREGFLSLGVEDATLYYPK